MSELENKIKNLDLKRITKRVEEKTGMNTRQLKKAELLYRQYLTLRSKYPEQIIVPPHLADAVWHEHLSNTEQYKDDCTMLFGHYLEHHVDDEESVLTKGWNNSKMLYAKEFNVDLLDAGQLASPCR